jgi:hypothetical protein
MAARSHQSGTSLRKRHRRLEAFLSLKLVTLGGNVYLERFDLAPQLAVIDAFEHRVERSFKAFENRRYEARCHDSSSSNRNFLPPDRVSIVSS